jgi:hydrogenase-4 component B
MEMMALTFLRLAFWSYICGMLAGVVCRGKDQAALVLTFGASSLAGVLGVAGAIMFLTSPAAVPQQLVLMPSVLPDVAFSIRLDPLGAFFTLIVSAVGLAISIYSMGYARSYFGRKDVGVLGGFFNTLLLATTFVFLADNAFFFLVAWEIMALCAYCLISFEHEQDETRNAGVLYFVMSHIGTGCLILGFLLLFQASGSYNFSDFRGLGASMPPGTRNAAFVLFLIGFGVKAGIVPLHIWLPAAHPVAPSNVSALLSGRDY